MVIVKIYKGNISNHVSWDPAITSPDEGTVIQRSHTEEKAFFNLRHSFSVAALIDPTMSMKKPGHTKVVSRVFTPLRDDRLAEWIKAKNSKNQEALWEALWDDLCIFALHISCSLFYHSISELSSFRFFIFLSRPFSRGINFQHHF